MLIKADELKAAFPIKVTLSGMSMLVKLIHEPKAVSSNSSYTIMNDNTGQIIATTECAFADYCHATRNFDMSNTSILKSTFSDKFYTVWKIDAG